MKIIMLVVLVVVCSGCAGLEVGGKLGLYEVADRKVQESTSSSRMPFKCYFTNCNQNMYEDK